MRIFLYFVLAATVVACSQGTSNNSNDINDSVAGYGTNVNKAMREDALRRAKVWMEPTVPVESFNFLEGVEGEGAISSAEEIKCKWDYKEGMKGNTPKFRCKTDDDVSLKVKYSKKKKNNNAEIPAEIAATRLLRALGFGADSMYTAKNIRCLGCPSDPWGYTIQLHSAFPEVRKKFLWTFGRQNRNGEYYYEPDFSDYTDFSFVAIEKKFGGHSIEVKNKDGWKWKELEKISSERGGSSKTEIDALVMMAVFLYHTDSKTDQQRLVCLDALTEEGYCERPMLIMQDLGATFGSDGPSIFKNHTKFNVEAWEKAPFWKDHEGCVVDIKDAPNGTFKEARISETGRLFLGGLLNRLTDPQITDLFIGARAHEFKNRGEGEIARWVSAFKGRREMITNRVPCPN